MADRDVLFKVDADGVSCDLVNFEIAWVDSDDQPALGVRILDYRIDGRLVSRDDFETIYRILRDRRLA